MTESLWIRFQGYSELRSQALFWMSLSPLPMANDPRSEGGRDLQIRPSARILQDCDPGTARYPERHRCFPPRVSVWVFRIPHSLLKLLHECDFWLRSCCVLESWIKEAKTLGHLVRWMCACARGFQGSEISGLDGVAVDWDLIFEKCTGVRDVKYTLRHGGKEKIDGVFWMKGRGEDSQRLYNFECMSLEGLIWTVAVDSERELKVEGDDIYQEVSERESGLGFVLKRSDRCLRQLITCCVTQNKRYVSSPSSLS